MEYFLAGGNNRPLCRGDTSEGDVDTGRPSEIDATAKKSPTWAMESNPSPWIFRLGFTR
jgi:hypothetical protein